ncbi:MAG: replication initiator protein [Microvirus sp.]|nr:MAG: replication initiator protein [Microvirus sp.]
MACFHPLDAFQTEAGSIVFSERGSIRRGLTLPCGQCVGCRLDRSRRWAMRCVHEASMYDVNSFVTLTYEDGNCPTSLNYGDFQLFMKRLRKKMGKVRFFMCGEYGEKLGRPHYHACLFGVHFDDRYLWSESSGQVRLYRSPLLESLWPHGFSTVGDVTFDSAAYVAAYCMKKVNGDRADAHYEKVSLSSGEIVKVRPEFARMSLKPGIGQPWFQKFSADVYGYDRDAVVLNGVKSKPPRYYDLLLKATDPDLAEYLEYDRYVRAGKVVSDCTPERLKVREAVTKARLSLKQRSI